jgi:hypothetical protein
MDDVDRLELNLTKAVAKALGLSYKTVGYYRYHYIMMTDAHISYVCTPRADCESGTVGIWRCNEYGSNKLIALELADPETTVEKIVGIIKKNMVENA